MIEVQITATPRASAASILFLACMLVLSACTEKPGQRHSGGAEANTPNGDVVPPATIPPAEVIKSIQTTNLDFKRGDIERYVDAVLWSRRNTRLAKWKVPANGYIYYAVSGLTRDQRLVFANIVAQFANQTGLRVVPYQKGKSYQIVFNYLDDLSEIARTPALRRIYCSAPGIPCATSAKSTRAIGYWKSQQDTDEAVVAYAYATKIDRTLSPNQLAAVFVKDILHAFLAEPTRNKADELQETLTSTNAQPLVAEGPNYSWRIPAMDLLYLRALYNPAIKSGMPIQDARPKLVQLMEQEQETPRRLLLASRFVLSSKSEPRSKNRQPPIYTTNFKISRADVDQFVNKALMINQRTSTPFLKWTPSKGEIIYFSVNGLDRKQKQVFETIVAEFAKRTDLPVRLHKTGTRINWLFHYLPDLGELGRNPELRRDYCKNADSACATSESNAWYVVNLSRKNGRLALDQYKYAGKLAPSLTGNKLAAQFVKDIVHAFIGGAPNVSMGKESVIGIGPPVVASGPKYSWKAEIRDLLLLRAIYDPRVQNGIAREVAAIEVSGLMRQDLQFPRQVYPKSTLVFQGSN